MSGVMAGGAVEKASNSHNNSDGTIFEYKLNFIIRTLGCIYRTLTKMI
jgi:hypothetical protein